MRPTRWTRTPSGGASTAASGGGPSAVPASIWPDELSVEHVSQLFNAWYMNTAADPIPVDLLETLKKFIAQHNPTRQYLKLKENRVIDQDAMNGLFYGNCCRAYRMDDQIVGYRAKKGDSAAANTGAMCYEFCSCYFLNSKLTEGCPHD